MRKEELPIAGFTPDGNFPLIHGEKGILDFDLCYSKESMMINENLEINEITGGISRNSVPDLCKMILSGNSQNLNDAKNKLSTYFSQNKIKHNISINTDQLVVEVYGKTSHAMHPEKGINAISHALLSIGYINKSNDLYREYSELIGLDFNGEKLIGKCKDELSGELTLNLGKIGLDQGKIRLWVNVRYPVTANIEHVLNSFENGFKNSVFSFDIIDHLKPLYVPRESPIIKTLMDVYRKHTGDNESQPIVIGGGTYARVLPNTVAFGPVYPGQKELAHEANEYIAKEHLLQLIDIYEEGIIGLMSMKI